MQKTKEVLKKVRTIELKTNKLVEGLLQGAYHSVFKGRGIEFSEVREYVPGDDIRAIDWNVTARMNFPYVKEFIEERDLTIYIVLDVSASHDFGYEETKDFEKAYRMQSLYRSYSDSLMGENVRVKVADLEAKYETAKK